MSPLPPAPAPLPVFKPGRRVLRVEVVRLTADGYAVGIGTLGIIDEQLTDDTFLVAWITEEGAVRSGPVPSSALNLVGRTSLTVPSAR